MADLRVLHGVKLVDADTPANSAAISPARNLAVEVLIALPTGANTIGAVNLAEHTVLDDDPVGVNGAVLMAGLVFDDTTPVVIEEGDAGYQRMSLNRNAYTVLRDDAGNERGVNVTAAILKAAPMIASLAEQFANNVPKIVAWVAEFATFVGLVDKADTSKLEEIRQKIADLNEEMADAPKGGGVYALSPFPFAGDVCEAACRGRYFDPVPEGEEPEDMTASFHALPETAQTHRLVAG